MIYTEISWAKKTEPILKNGSKEMENIIEGSVLA